MAPAKKAIKKAASVLDEFEGYPNLTVLERRLEDPSDPGTLPVYLKDDPRPSCADLQHYARSKQGAKCLICRTPFRRWYVRWINGQVPNRLHSIVHNKAYVKVMKDELIDLDQIPDLAATVDQTVRKGEKGHIVLVKIPFRAYAAIKQAELDRRNARDKSAKKVREDLADAAGASLGDEAGGTIANMTAEFSRPSSTMADEMADK